MNHNKNNIYYNLSWVILITFTFVFISINVWDSDVWHIFSDGRYVLENHAFQYVNHTNMIEGLAITDQDWLWDTVIYFMYSNFGIIGTIVLRLACFILTLIGLNTIMRNRDVRKSVRMPVLFIMVLLLYVFFSERPSSVTLLLFVFEIYCIEKFFKSGNKLFLLLVILSSFLEVNFHASYFLFHILVILPYLIGTIRIKGFKLISLGYTSNVSYYRIWLILTGIVSFGVGFLNPYTYKSVFYVLYSFFDKDFKLQARVISEQMPLEFSFSIWVIVLLVTLFISMRVFFKVKKPYISDVLFFIAGIILLFVAYKNYQFYSLGWFLFILNFINSVLDIELINNIYNFYKKRSIFSYFKYGCVLGCMLISAVLIFLGSFSFYQQKNLKSESALLQEYVSDKNNANIYAEFNNSSYLGYYGYKILIDARPELYIEKFTDKINLLSYVNDIKSREDFDKIFNDFEFDYAYVYGDMSKLYFDMSDNWVFLGEEDDYYSLYERIKS